MKQEFHIPVKSVGATAVELLADASGLSKQKIKNAMQKGCVWLEKPSNKINQGEQGDALKQARQGAYMQRLRRAKKVLQANDILHFYYDDVVLNSEPKEALLVSDEGDYSIWNKPSGMFSQGSKWGDHCTIYRWAEKHLKPERTAFIVHRLDRAASGLIILAHKKKTAAAFSKMFQLHEVEKHYRASVRGDFSSLLDKGETRKTMTQAIDDKPAISHVTFVEYNKNTNESVLDVQIETGRKHQIRKHLSVLEFPVVGDRLYGASTIGDLKLTAVSLRFLCPVLGEERFYNCN